MSTAFGPLRGRRVIVTGHTGFKGSWLSLWLSELGARVFGYALPPPTDPSHFEVARIGERLTGAFEADIRDASALDRALIEADPEVIFHLAAQSIVREGYRTPLETFDVNTLGTAHLLEAVRRRARPAVVICVTSDKCYEPHADSHPHTESDPLGGLDPYSASKGATEVVISSYRRSFFAPDALDLHGVRLASARAGNVIGGGDWSADRIVVDVMEALRLGKTLKLRNPEAVRPWQHVLEPLGGYLTLATGLLTNPRPDLCDAFNFGPRPEDERTVRDLVARLHGAWRQGPVEHVVQGDSLRETRVLRLAIDRAADRLGWRPRWGLDTAVEYTADWYRRLLEGETDMQRLAVDQIRSFEDAG